MSHFTNVVLTLAFLNHTIQFLVILTQEKEVKFKIVRGMATDIQCKMYLPFSVWSQVLHNGPRIYHFCFH